MSSNATHADPNVTAAQTLLANDHLSFRRKVTYGFTDMSGNLLYCIISSYMLYFFYKRFWFRSWCRRDAVADWSNF
nr:hypothetical protein [Secundilactobacillus kimchicus]